MIGLALSGGGSRAIAFHLGCLRALADLGILDRVKVMSTISGGSVIGAFYAYRPEKSFEEFDRDIRGILRKGFHRQMLWELIKPWNLLRTTANSLLCALDWITATRLSKREGITRYPSRTDLFQAVLRRELFPALRMRSPTSRDLDIVIGACELRTGTAFRFGNRSSGGWRQGELIEPEPEVAFAVAASAAYPLLLPALDRTWTFQKKGEQVRRRVLLTDGGVYENLGVPVLEPGRSTDHNLHAFNCEHLIVCSAGHGQESGRGLPNRLFSRVAQSFQTIHRRVQDGTMQRLHQLKQSQVIKGFAMPYLGQQDARLPFKPPNLVPRSEVITYPTDFAAMPDRWIDTLSRRGEQLTRALVPYYLSDICS